MKSYQDWFNGADYHRGSEQKVEIESMMITKEGKLQQHERVEMYYVQEGSGEIEINGKTYSLSPGSFLCLYIHHFYRFKRIETPLHVIRVRFYLGLFMFMGFEQHKGDENEQLVYHTQPVQTLEKEEQVWVMQLMNQLLCETKEQRFCSENIIIYLTMQLHSLYCRFAFERRQMQEDAWDVWKVIVKILLETGDRTSLRDYAALLQLNERTLNQQIKKTCGYTFLQLQTISKISTACSLLHFPDLNLGYISDYLGFNNVQDFYRVFQRVMHQTPRTFQQQQICDQKIRFAREKLIACMQYLYLHIQEPLQIETAASALGMKAATLKQLIQQYYHCTFHQMVKMLKIKLAAALLCADSRSVTEVAAALGYGSLVTFQRQFKEIMGQTPTEYRLEK